MGQVMVRYTVKPDAVAENTALVRRVYEELRRSAPPDFHYATFVLDDGVSFVHVASTADDGRNPLMENVAFRAFQAGIDDRCVEPPSPGALTEIGSYGFWSQREGA